MIQVDLHECCLLATKLFFLLTCPLWQFSEHHLYFRPDFKDGLSCLYLRIESYFSAFH